RYVFTGIPSLPGSCFSHTVIRSLRFVYSYSIYDFIPFPVRGDPQRSSFRIPDPDAPISATWQPQRFRDHRIHESMANPLPGARVDVCTPAIGARGSDTMKGSRKETIVGGILVGLMAVVFVFF
ncbi:MAG TPA: hypothetical protein VF847_02995, partial [Candidatus Deferrimicrobiaceae bacterium]